MVVYGVRGWEGENVEIWESREIGELKEIGEVAEKS